MNFQRTAVFWTRTGDIHWPRPTLTWLNNYSNLKLCHTQFKWDSITKFNIKLQSMVKPYQIIVDATLQSKIVNYVKQKLFQQATYFQSKYFTWIDCCSNHMKLMNGPIHLLISRVSIRQLWKMQNSSSINNNSAKTEWKISEKNTSSIKII